MKNCIANERQEAKCDTISDNFQEGEYCPGGGRASQPRQGVSRAMQPLPRPCTLCIMHNRESGGPGSRPCLASLTLTFVRPSDHNFLIVYVFAFLYMRIIIVYYGNNKDSDSISCYSPCEK